LEEGTNLLRVPLQASQGGDNLGFEVGFIRHDHPAHGVGLQMLPYKFVRITIRRVWREEEQLQLAAERLDKGFGLFRPMRGTSIDDQENLARLANQQPFEKFDKDVRIYPA
jgi:hypothetical protein